MQRFAIYDLDRTITRLPTWSRFLLYAVRRRGPWRAALIPLAGAAAVLRLAGLIDRDRLKEIMHRLLLGRAITPGALDRLAQGFADREAAGNVFGAARARIAADRAAGCRLVVATAAYAFYARPIAMRLDIDDVIATQAATDDTGNVLARIDGNNCYGAVKHRMIAAWVADRTGADEERHIRFYSDHLTDLPTLEWADEPIVVNPGTALRRIATDRGWEIAEWAADRHRDG